MSNGTRRGSVPRVVAPASDAECVSPSPARRTPEPASRAPAALSHSFAPHLQADKPGEGGKNTAREKTWEESA